MDPKSVANLDPKLRETYERVMGSNPSGTAAAPVTSAAATDNFTATMPTTTDTATPSSPPDLSAPVSPEPQLSEPINAPTSPDPATSPYPSFGSSTAAPAGAEIPTMQPLASPASVAQATQNTSSLIKLLYIAGGIVFFIVYVFFWIKIFNYQLPF